MSEVVTSEVVIKDKVNTTSKKDSKPVEPTKSPPSANISPKTDIKLLFTSENIELVNLGDGKTHAIIPKENGRIRLSNNHLYRIPIEDKKLNINNFHVVKHNERFAELLRILTVRNGIVTIEPILPNFELKSGDVIGKLI